MHSFIAAVDRLWCLGDDPLSDDQFDWELWDDVEREYTHLRALEWTGDAFYRASYREQNPHGYIEVGHYTKTLSIPCCGTAHRDQYSPRVRIDDSIQCDNSRLIRKRVEDIVAWYENLGLPIPPSCPYEDYVTVYYEPSNEPRSVSITIDELITDLLHMIETHELPPPPRNLRGNHNG